MSTPSSNIDRREEESLDPLGSHIYSTYFWLRVGMAVLALVFPPLLWIAGHYIHTPLQNSMSAYYHSELRDVFVGILFAIGFFLFLYKGFSKGEDWTLNIAGALAIGIAVFPMDPDAIFNCKPLCDEDCMRHTQALDRTSQIVIDSGLHGWSASLFFVAIFFVCAVFSRETLKTMEDRQRKIFWSIYFSLGAAMVVLPALLVAMRRFGAFGQDVCKDPTIFYVEWAAVWSFGIFWIVKSLEMWQSRADYRYPVRRQPKVDKAALSKQRR